MCPIRLAMGCQTSRPRCYNLRSGHRGAAAPSQIHALIARSTAERSFTSKVWRVLLDRELPVWMPVPAPAEMQATLEQVVSEPTGSSGFDLKLVMRTGMVANAGNRNCGDVTPPIAVARHRTRRGIDCLCRQQDDVRPRRAAPWDVKRAGMAWDFYRQRVGLKALERLKSRKGNCCICASCIALPNAHPSSPDEIRREVRPATSRLLAK